MKRYLRIVVIMILVLSTAGAASALTWDKENKPSSAVYINNDSNVPDSSNWYQLLLPIWYKHADVTAFTIDLYGHGDDSGYTIDAWRKLGDSTAIGKKIVGFDVSNGARDFILEMNLMDGKLYRNYKKSDGTWTGLVYTGQTLQDLSLADFDGLSSFLVGYACHFYLDKTTVHIEQRTTGTGVPEPATMLLLGFGLAGLAGVRRSRK